MTRIVGQSGASGVVVSVTAPGPDPGIGVDNTDPANPKLSLTSPPIVAVQGATTAPLPAYSVVSGSLATGDAVIQANAPGAFPLLDGTVSLVPSLTEDVQSRFLLHNSPTGVENGVWSLLNSGSGVTLWSAKMYSGLNSPALIQGSRINVLFGSQRGGGRYHYRARAAINMATTKKFWWRTDVQAGRNEVQKICDTDFNWAAVNTVANGQQNQEGFIENVAVGTVTLSPGARNRSGVLALNTGANAAGRATITQGSSLFLGGNFGLYFSFKGGVPILSDPTNTFSFNVGISGGTVTAAIPDGVAVSFQPLVSATNLLIATGNTAGGGGETTTDTGLVLQAGVDAHVEMWWFPGDPTLYVDVNGVPMAPITLNLPAPTSGLVLLANMLKSATATSRAFEIDWLRVYIQTPELRVQDSTPPPFLLLATPYDVAILNSVGPGTYSENAARIIIADTTVKTRIDTGPPFTTGLNPQEVSVARAKIDHTNYCSICCTGDSISKGATQSGFEGNGFRDAINTSLLGIYGAAVALEWEGPNFSANATEPTQYTNGTGGATTLSLWTESSSKFGAGVPRLPDVLVVLCGTNDAAGGITQPTFDARYRTLITAYNNLLPAAKIVVSFVPENPTNAPADALVTAYNANLPATWTALEALLGITLYRTPAQFGLLAGDMSPLSPIHPNNATGYPKLVAQLTAPIEAAVAATGKV